MKTTNKAKATQGASKASKTNKVTFIVTQGETLISQSVETKKEIDLKKTAQCFAGMLHELHTKVERLKNSGFKVKKPFSYYKPFSLTIKVNDKILIDSEQANKESLLQIVLKARTAIESPKPLASAIFELSEVIKIKI
jgi:ATPase subunit of ABC transporter with duplicated ATPase domains